MTGIQNYTDIDPEHQAPLAATFDSADVDWMGNLISIGACIGLVFVAMILMLGQTRVGFAMARDGLLPRSLAKVHPTYGTPHRITLIAGIAIAAISGLVDLETLALLVNIGTLFAFVLVSIAAVVMCVYLMLNLTGDTWIRFLVWMALGVVYFVYGRRHSRLGRGEEPRSLERQPSSGGGAGRPASGQDPGE